MKMARELTPSETKLLQDFSSDDSIWDSNPSYDGTETASHSGSDQTNNDNESEQDSIIYPRKRRRLKHPSRSHGISSEEENRKPGEESNSSSEESLKSKSVSYANILLRSPSGTVTSRKVLRNSFVPPKTKEKKRRCLNHKKFEHMLLRSGPFCWSWLSIFYIYGFGIIFAIELEWFKMNQANSYKRLKERERVRHINVDLPWEKIVTQSVSLIFEDPFQKMQAFEVLFNSSSYKVRQYLQKWKIYNEGLSFHPGYGQHCVPPTDEFIFLQNDTDELREIKSLAYQNKIDANLIPMPIINWEFKDMTKLENFIETKLHNLQRNVIKTMKLKTFDSCDTRGQNTICKPGIEAAEHYTCQCPIKKSNNTSKDVKMVGTVGAGCWIASGSECNPNDKVDSQINPLPTVGQPQKVTFCVANTDCKFVDKLTDKYETCVCIPQAIEKDGFCNLIIP